MHAVQRLLIVVCVVSLGASALKAEPDVSLGQGRQPQVAIGAADEVFVVHASGATIQVNASTDGGKSFGEPRIVAQLPTLPLGMRRGPRIAVAKSAVVVTAITGEKGGGKDGDLFAWVSTDQGKKWTRSKAPLNRASGSAREGLHGMAAGADGTLACVWLDLRNVRPGKPGTEIWGATSTDGGKSWSHDVLVHRNPEGTVCQCCHPSVAIDDKGVITVLFRNALAGSRDMYLTTSKDGGKTFSPAGKLGVDTWSLNACPMDGGALAVQGGKVVTVWRRDKTLYSAQAGQPEQLIARGSQPVVAGGIDGLYSIWMDGNGLAFQIPGVRPSLFSRTGSYASIATAPDGKGPVVAAWEQDGQVMVRTIKAR